MAKKLGIELARTRCTLVALALGAGGVRVRALSSLDAGSDEPERLARELRRVRTETGLPRRARVVLWAASDLVPAPDGDYKDRIDALHLAGVSVESVVSPPEALAAVAASLGPPTDSAVAWLAVNPDGAALAVVRDGELLLGQELEAASVEDTSARDRRPFARRLGAAVTRALRDASAGVEIERVVLCGALPNLRSLTLPLGEVLARPIEILDTLDGIDTGGLNMPILDFQKHVAGLRLAWAMASGGHGSRRPGRPRPRSWALPVAAAGVLTAGAAALVVSFWPAPWRAREEPAGQVLSGAGVTQVSAIESQAPAVEPPPASLPAAPRPGPPRGQAAPAQTESRAAAAAPAERRAAPAGAWKLRSILVAPGRALALVDGRIVGPGDRVGSETIVQITETAVVLADPRGRRRQVGLRHEVAAVVVR